MEQVHPSIAGIQTAAKEAAEVVAREKTAAEGNNGGANGGGPPKKEGEPPVPAPKPAPPAAKPAPAPAPAAGDEFSLAKSVKEKYNLDLSEEEILARLKPPETPAPPPVSAKKAGPAPKPEDVTDELVGAFFEKQKKPNLVASHVANAKKSDFDLVKESQLSVIKQQFPEMKDEQAEELIKERYYIPLDENDTSTYSAEELELGKFLLKRDAENLRTGTQYQIDSVRNMLHNERIEAYNQEIYKDSIDQFIATVPKQLVLPLGKSGTIELGDYPVELEADTINTVAEIMREPVKLLSKFRPAGAKGNEGFDLKLMYDHLLKAELFDKVIKSTAVDYYSKGITAVEEKLNNDPDLNKIKPPEKKDSKKDEQEKAAEFNKKQIEDNTGRFRKTR